MKRSASLLALAGFLACASPAKASPPFQLALTDGSGWVSPGAQEKTSVFLFWDERCPACLIELGQLAALKTRFPGLLFVTVYTGPRQDARRMSAKHMRDIALTQAIAPVDPRGLLAQLGNRSGALPFSVVFDRQGRSCGSHAGELTADALQHALTAC